MKLPEMDNVNGTDLQAKPIQEYLIAPASNRMFTPAIALFR
jgi:hypothetical protein